MAASKNFPGYFNAKIIRKIECVYRYGDSLTTKTLIYMETEDGTHIIAYPDPTERFWNNLMNMSFYDNVESARKVWAKIVASGVGGKLISKKIIK
jgi:hypothetical protein